MTIDMTRWRRTSACLVARDVSDLSLRNGVKQNVPRDWNDKAIQVSLFP